MCSVQALYISAPQVKDLQTKGHSYPTQVEVEILQQAHTVWFKLILCQLVVKKPHMIPKSEPFCFQR